MDFILTAFEIGSEHFSLFENTLKPIELQILHDPATDVTWSQHESEIL